MHQLLILLCARKTVGSFLKHEDCTARTRAEKTLVFINAGSGQNELESTAAPVTAQHDVMHTPRALLHPAITTGTPAPVVATPNVNPPAA